MTPARGNFQYLADFQSLAGFPRIPCWFTLLLCLLYLRHTFTNCFSASMPAYRVSSLPHILFTGQRAGKAGTHQASSVHLLQYSLQTAEQMVTSASLQLCKMKGRFYNTNLATPKIWIFTLSAEFSFQLSSPFSCSAFTGKEHSVPQRDKVENQQILQSIASEFC